MNRTLVNYFKILLLIGIMFVLSSCAGGKTSQEIRFYSNVSNGDISGIRTLTYQYNYGENKNEYVPDVNAIRDMVDRECPSEMSYNFIDENEVITIEFEISFSSYEEYVDKCISILNKSGYNYDRSSIRFDHDDDIFLYNMDYNESFITTELLGWFKNGLIGYGLVPANRQDNIFYDYNTTAYINGKEASLTGGTLVAFEKEGNINIDNLNIYTTINYDGSINREIYFILRNDDNYVSSIVEEFKRRFSNIEINKTNEEDVYTISLIGNNLNLDEANLFMKTFYKTDSNVLSVTKDNDNYHLEEIVDISKYLKPEDIHVFNYYLNDLYSCDVVVNNNSFNDELQDGRGVVKINNIRSSIKIDATYDPIFSVITIDNDVKKKNTIERKILLTLRSNNENQYRYLHDKYLKEYGAVINSIYSDEEGLHILTKEDNKTNLQSLYNPENNTLSANKGCILGVFCNVKFYEDFDLHIFTNHAVEHELAFRVPNMNQDDFRLEYDESGTNVAHIDYNENEFHLNILLLEIAALYLIFFAVQYFHLRANGTLKRTSGNRVEEIFNAIVANKALSAVSSENTYNKDMIVENIINDINKFNP